MIRTGTASDKVSRVFEYIKQNDVKALDLLKDIFNPEKVVEPLEVTITKGYMLANFCGRYFYQHGYDYKAAYFFNLLVCPKDPQLIQQATLITGYFKCLGGGHRSQKLQFHRSIHIMRGFDVLRVG